MIQIYTSSFIRTLPKHGITTGITMEKLPDFSEVLWGLFVFSAILSVAIWLAAHWTSRPVASAKKHVSPPNTFTARNVVVNTMYEILLDGTIAQMFHVTEKRGDWFRVTVYPLERGHEYDWSIQGWTDAINGDRLIRSYDLYPLPPS